MDIFQSIILGIIQGITEWLPVSSSGHLVLVQKLMGLNMPVAYDVVLHLGTLIPVFIIFRNEILKLLKAFLTFDRKNENFKLGIFVLISTAITGAIGISFLKFFESLFSSALAVGTGFIITGIFLLISKFFKGERKIKFTDSVLIGLAQSLSIAPGISRSGLTISAGLMRKIDKKSVLTFSFLLSILAIVGAQLVEMKNFTMENADPAVLFCGILTSAITGYLAIKFLLRTILSDKFHLFAVYCFALGVAVIFLI